MIRKIIKIDKEKCNGCGLCAAAYDKEAVEARMAAKKAAHKPLPCGCPGTQSRALKRHAKPFFVPAGNITESQLSQWPVQIKLTPVNAPYFENANLLIAADCTAYAYANFHNDFIAGRITLVGCPKLDSVDYAEKLTEILINNSIQDITVVRMEVPCCGGIELAAKTALQNSRKMIPWRVVTIGTDGQIVSLFSSYSNKSQINKTAVLHFSGYLPLPAQEGVL